MQANSAFRKSLEIAPSSGITHYYYGRFLYDNKRYTQASHHLKEKLANGNPTTLGFTTISDAVYIAQIILLERFHPMRMHGLSGGCPLQPMPLEPSIFSRVV